MGEIKDYRQIIAIIRLNVFRNLKIIVNMDI